MRSWLMILLLAGCARRDLAVAPSEVPELLRIADVQWEQRGEIGLERVESTLYEAYRIEPRNPEVLWRLVRLNVTMGLVEPEPRASQYAFAEARSLGMSCLELDPSFVQYRSELGWSGAVGLIDADDTACSAWTALAWARWMAAHGAAAAALDIVPLSTLITQTTELAVDDPREVVTYADALLAALRPPWEGGDLEQAGVLLARAIRLRPDELYRRVDMIRLVALPLEDDVLAREMADAILAAPAVTPEDVLAHTIATAVLEELGPPG